MDSSLIARRSPLADTGLDVAPLCLGGSVFGWTIDADRSVEVLDAYVAAGGNFIDTADIYSNWVDGNEGGDSERIIGDWLRDRGGRDELVVATKVGMAMSYGTGLGRDHVLDGVGRSLDRLGIDTIDLLYAHRPDPATPIAETMRAFHELVQAGKVRALGLSNVDAAQLRAAQEVAEREGLTRISVVQNEHSLLVREEVEGELQDLCVAEGIALAPYSSLAAGFLTGKYVEGAPQPDSARAGGALQRFGNERGWALLRVVRDVAARHDATPSQVALAWLAAQPGVVAPIASASSASQLRELLAGPTLELDTDDLDRLAAAG